MRVGWVVGVQWARAAVFGTSTVIATWGRSLLLDIVSSIKRRIWAIWSVESLTFDTVDSTFVQSHDIHQSLDSCCCLRKVTFADKFKNWLKLLYCTNKEVIKVWHILENLPIQVDVTDVIAPEHVLFVWMCVFFCVQFYSEADAREGKVSQNGSVVWRLSDFSALCRCHSCRSVSVWWAELSNSTRIHRHTHPFRRVAAVATARRIK